ncbi:hypothetical protein B0H21DRAFT_575850 [Amylocystis lapponica]|nr:hypothetical protein B0H21DRAFT_575850 [Amylocystis lapponica]
MFFNWGLQAVLSVQVYLYYLFFPQDSIPLKMLVYGTLCFEWVQTGLITADAFDIYVYSYGDINTMVSFHNSWFSIPIMCGFIAAVVQIFFARHIYILSKSRILVGVVVFCSVGQFSVAVLSGVLMLRDMPSAGVASRVTLVLSAWLIASAIVDVLIAIVMTTFLIKVKTGLAPTDDWVDCLIRLVIETGTLTATIAIIDVVLFYTTPTVGLCVFSADDADLTPCRTHLYMNAHRSSLRNCMLTRSWSTSTIELSCAVVKWTSMRLLMTACLDRAATSISGDPRTQKASRSQGTSAWRRSTCCANQTCPNYLRKTHRMGLTVARVRSLAATTRRTWRRTRLLRCNNAIRPFL